MENSEIIVAVIIHIIIPIIGLILFLRLLDKMRESNIEKILVLELLFVFINYGSLIIIFLTNLFWYWSGMASVGFFYLITIAPISMIIIAIKNYRKQSFSKFHLWIYKLSLLYPFGLFFIFLVGMIK